MAVGIDVAIRTKPMGRRAPNLSVTAPNMKRQKMSPKTETMLVVHMSCLLNSSVSLTSVSKGAMENTMKNSTKKDHHE